MRLWQAQHYAGRLREHLGPQARVRVHCEPKTGLAPAWFIRVAGAPGRERCTDVDYHTVDAVERALDAAP